MVTVHFCFPLFLPVPPSELWETSSKSSMIIIYATFLLHFLQSISASGKEVEEENSERTRESHPLQPLGCHRSSGEKQICKPPNILHLITLLKAETGKCLALRIYDLPQIIFLIYQLNSQETGIIQKKETNQEWVIILIFSQSLKYKGLSLGVTLQVKLETSLQRFFY